MNTSPKRSNVNAKRATVTCMIIEALLNKLEKGQNHGDATKVATGGGIEILDESVPRIEVSNIGKYNIINNRRILSEGQNGEKVHTGLSLDYQFAKMKESREASLEDYEEEK